MFSVMLLEGYSQLHSWNAGRSVNTVKTTNDKQNSQRIIKNKNIVLISMIMTFESA